MVVVRVSEGFLEGEVVSSVLDREYYSFKGIPYAQPPIGDLRFKAPQPPLPWDGVRSAKEYGPVCFQFDYITGTVKAGSEDCLYLNVYTPSLEPNTPLPVMFWIHGGGFVSGSGNDDFYGPDFLVDKDVIVVTFNYRLEILGFLCLDIEDAPGNAGMKDQVAALRWVQKNIKNFGGDPNNVTIFGESAGGASVSCHLLSPMSKGLFKRAIIQSGVLSCHWAQNFEARERALVLARKLGYDGQSDDDLLNFFKKAPVESLINICLPIVMSESICKDTMMYFTMVNEKRFDNSETFLSGDVYECMREGIHKDVDVMVGYTADEGATCLPIVSEEDIDGIFNRYLESLVPSVIRYRCTISDQLEVGRRMKLYYFGNTKINKDNIIKLLDYYSMNSFVFDIMLWIKHCAKRDENKTYLYKFTCQSERNFIAKTIFKSKFIKVEKPLVAHADDLPYLFNMKIANLSLDKDSKGFSMIKNVTKLWTDFAKLGNPTADDTLEVKWSPYTPERGDYLEIGEKLTPGNFPDKEETSFWESIYKQYLPQILP